MQRLIAILALAVVATAAGCGGGSRPAGPRRGDAGAGTGPDGRLDGAIDPAPTETDLPCEVAETLAARCWACHGARPAAGVPTSLVTRADLARASAVDAAQTYAQRSVARMRAPTLPMPPAGPRAPEPEIAALEAWIADAMPAGSCTVRDVFDTPVTCTSGRTWTGGNLESPEMRPGGTCVGCHDAEAPEKRFWLGGTVYPSAHEPDDCSGADTGGAAIVEVTDAEGRVYRMRPNAAGNFFLMRPTDEDVQPGGALGPAFTFPYTARVLVGGAERAMLTPQTSGDCNSCHTLEGTMDAPGRIVLP